MKIYHGSTAVIEKPLYKGSDPTNDYGSAFYVTLDIEDAKEWACKDDIIGVVNEYDVNSDSFKKLKILDLRSKTSQNALTWIAILLHYRKLDEDFISMNRQALEWIKKYYVNIDDYDVVIGYRADDSYFEFPKQFISNNLAYDDLLDIYLLGNIGIQYAFISQKSIDLINYIDFIELDNSYLNIYNSKVKIASESFDAYLSRPRDINKKYIIDLMREDNE